MGKRGEEGSLCEADGAHEPLANGPYHIVTPSNPPRLAVPIGLSRPLTGTFLHLVLPKPSISISK